MIEGRYYLTHPIGLIKDLVAQTEVGFIQWRLKHRPPHPFPQRILRNEQQQQQQTSSNEVVEKIGSEALQRKLLVANPTELPKP